jgi:hypothetical protein
MNLKAIVCILLVAAVPMYAQAQRRAFVHGARVVRVPLVNQATKYLRRSAALEIVSLRERLACQFVCALSDSPTR